MDDVRGDFFGPPHGTTPAAVVVASDKNPKQFFFFNFSTLSRNNKSNIHYFEITPFHLNYERKSVDALWQNHM